ncbi:MAG: hypothetical protein ACRDTT_34590, partial [Pseudonocardiaceae bacterium]
MIRELNVNGSCASYVTSPGAPAGLATARRPNQADDTGYRVGDTAQVLVKGGPQDVTVAGIAKFGDADSPGGASFVLFTLDAAQRLIAEPDKFDSILVIADAGISQTEIVQRIAPELPTGTEAVTGEEITKESQDEIEQGLS